jgi:hypothetical protein
MVWRLGSLQSHNIDNLCLMLLLYLTLHKAFVSTYKNTMSSITVTPDHHILIHYGHFIIENEPLTHSGGASLLKVGGIFER